MLQSNKKKYRETVFFFDKMEMKQIITATVAVILVCLVAIPIINSLQSDFRTNYGIPYDNANFYYSEIVEGTTTITINSTSDSKINVNGENIEILGEISIPIIISDDFTLTTIPNGSLTNFVYWLDGGMNFQGYMQSGTFTINADSKTIECSNLVFTSQNPSGPSTINTSYTQKCYTISKTGNLVSAQITSTDTDIYIPDSGWFAVFNNSQYMVALEDGNIVYRTPNTADVSVTINDDPIEGVHNISKITVSSTSTTDVMVKVGNTQLTTGTIVVPKTVYGLTNDDSIVYTLVNLIPILLISALLIGIGYSIMRRD